MDPESNGNEPLPPKPGKVQQTNEIVQEEMPFLHKYYAKHFPVEELFRWLNYNGEPRLSLRRREIVYETGRYVSRYNSYVTPESLRNGICEHVPKRLQFGAIWKGVPNNFSRPNEQFPDMSQYKELCIDVDFDDQDFIQKKVKSPSETESFTAAWSLAKVQISIHKKMLEDLFAFKHIYKGFSGRRGYHLIIADKRVMKMNDSERTAIFNHLTLDWGAMSDEEAKNVLSHPSYSFLYDFVTTHPSFFKFLEQQQIFRNEHRVSNMEKIIPSSWISKADVNDIRNHILEKFRTNNSIKDGRRMWTTFVQSLKAFLVTKLQSSYSKAKGTLDHHSTSMLESEMQRILHYAVARMTFPVIDKGVMVQRNHLLRMPFSVHETSYVAIPLDESEFMSEDTPNFITFRDVLKDPSILEPFKKIFREQFLRDFQKSYPAMSAASLEF
jgi:predicted DNA primase small subunit